jgi:hypothetical protein
MQSLCFLSSIYLFAFYLTALSVAQTVQRPTFLTYKTMYCVTGEVLIDWLPSDARPSVVSARFRVRGLYMP